MSVFPTLFLLSVCFSYGNSAPRISAEARVINGEDAQLGQYPWHVGIVAFFSLSDLTSVHLCSGAIISEEWIVTSAYCVDGSEFVGVHAGSISNYDADGVVIIAINHVVHPEFNNVTLRNDIALVLVDPLTFDDNINAIALADEDLEAGIFGTVCGWGHSGHDDNDNETYILQCGTVSTINNSDCQQVYGVDAVPPSVVCTSGGISSPSPCFGDAGAPLVVNADSSPLLMALFSFIGSPGCELGYPAGYFRIAYYREWISEESGV